jgi:hypothetical protein
MVTASPPRFGLAGTAWVLIAAVLIVVLAVMALYIG